MILKELLQEIDICINYGDIEKLESLKGELLECSNSYSNSEKDTCQLYLSRIDNAIFFLQSKVDFKNQKDKLENFINTWNDNDLMKLEYAEPYGKYVGVDLFIGGFFIAIMFNGKELQTYFYLPLTGPAKQFVLKRNLPENHYSLLQKFKGDHYSQSATYGNWADLIITFIKSIENDSVNFIKMCESSCPFNKDGTHKFKEWKTFAKVEITYDENTELVQGVKRGENVPGSHVVGGNGSYRIWNKGVYIIQYTVDRMAGEKPIRNTYKRNADSYLRGLMERLGRSIMPYEMLNSKLKDKIEVITRDMDKDPEDREFYPLEYNNDWVDYLSSKFKNII